MTASVKLAVGKRYDRDEIYKMFGGNKQSALPFKDGAPVCGCYDPQMNPRAPEEILVGVGKFKERYSQIAAERNLVLPIFLKRATAEYEFKGCYRALRYSTDSSEIKQKNNTGRNDVAGVLYFEEVKD